MILTRILLEVLFLSQSMQAMMLLQRFRSRIHGLKLHSSSSSSSDVSQPPAKLSNNNPRVFSTTAGDDSKFTFKDLPEETMYILDGTAMLFNSYYSKKRIIGSEMHLTPEASQSVLQSKQVLEIIERNRRKVDGKETKEWGKGEEEEQEQEQEEGNADIPFVDPSNGLVPASPLVYFAEQFASFILNVKPKYVVAAFDTGECTFRDAIVDTYKATRSEPPTELVPLFGLAPVVLEAMGCKSYSVVGYEADDVMATLGRWGRSRGMNVVHVSVDKDMLQLIDTGVHVMKPWGFREIVGPDEVEETYGVPPAKLIDLMVLMGDKSDNVSGVKGCGPRIASALLQTFGSIDGMFEALQLDKFANDILTPQPLPEEIRRALMWNQENESQDEVAHLSTEEKKKLAKDHNNALKKSVTLFRNGQYCFEVKRSLDLLSNTLRERGVKASAQSLFVNLVAFNRKRVEQARRLITLRDDVRIEGILNFDMVSDEGEILHAVNIPVGPRVKTNAAGEEGATQAQAPFGEMEKRRYERERERAISDFKAVEKALHTAKQMRMESSSSSFFSFSSTTTNTETNAVVSSASTSTTSTTSVMLTTSNFKFRGETTSAEEKLKAICGSLMGPLQKLRLHYRHLDS